MKTAMASNPTNIDGGARGTVPAPSERAMLSHALVKAVGEGSLRVLDLTGGLVEPRLMSSLASAIQKSTCALETLNLGGNRLGDRGCAYIARAVGPNTSILAVDLCDTGVTSAGATTLARAFQRHPTLAYLYLGLNAVGPEGALALARSLPSITQLVAVDLSNNAIGDKGATAFAEAMTTSPDWSLRVLHLANNEIGELGGLELAQALSRGGWKHLKNLYLEGNSFSAFVLERFREAAAARPHLRLVTEIVSSGEPA